MMYRKYHIWMSEEKKTGPIYPGSQKTHLLSEVVR